jgi:hypothetical protein
MADRRGRTSSRAAAPFVAAALAFAVLACDSTPSVSPPPSTAATPVLTEAPSLAATLTPSAPPPTSPATEAPTEPAGLAQCGPADIKASHGLVEGAAGSRLTTVELSVGVACSVDLFPAFGLVDDDGSALVGSVAQGSGRIDLVAGEGYQSNVRLANWCADEPAFPLTLELHLATETEGVTGGSFPDQGDLPPCNGDTQGPILEATAWELVP